MNVGTKPGIVTSKEIQVIETYVKGLSKLLDSSNALKRLKLFSPIEVSSPSSPNGFYYASEQVEAVYEYYENENPKLFSKQEIEDYETLRHRAIDFCQTHELINY